MFVLFLIAIGNWYNCH